METQETLESRVLDAQKRRGPLEGPIRQILESQDRMEANVAKLTARVDAALGSRQAAIDMVKAMKPVTRLFWRLGL